MATVAKSGLFHVEGTLSTVRFSKSIFPMDGKLSGGRKEDRNVGIVAARRIKPIGMWKKEEGTFFPIP